MKKGKWIFLGLVIFVCANPALLLAKEPKNDNPAKEESLVTAADKNKQEKDALIANINGMNNQQLRVTVLQQMLNEELGKLRNIEAVFSDQYKLDVEKFRKGLYRFDEKLGKIIEQPAPVVKK